MEIILAKDYPSLGFVGDALKVKNGYARNYLIPNGIAVEASSRNASALKHRLAGIQAVKKALKAEAEAKVADLKKLDITLVLKVGEGGKSFGSIGTKDIEAALNDKGIEISRKQIQLVDPIRTVGEFPIKVKLHSEITAEILVKVNPERSLGPQTPKKRKGDAEGDESKNLEASAEDFQEGEFADLEDDFEGIDEDSFDDE